MTQRVAKLPPFAPDRAKLLRVLRGAEISALILAGVLAGRIYSYATASIPEEQRWSISAAPGGFVAGPFEILDGHGTSLLNAPPGAVFGQTDLQLTYACIDGACEGGEVRGLWLKRKEQP